MTKPDGDAAFPMNNRELIYETGMSLRDYFAAKAMHALIQRLGAVIAVAGTDVHNLLPDAPTMSKEGGREIQRAISILSFEYADAMIAERAK